MTTHKTELTRDEKLKRLKASFKRLEKKYGVTLDITISLNVRPTCKITTYRQSLLRRIVHKIVVKIRNFVC